jgi:SnoaL-like domain
VHKGTGVVVLLLSACQIGALAHAGEARPLTAMDYIEIQQLVNRLNIALDYCTNGGQDFADLFAEGGRFVIDEGNGNPRTFNTRQQLVSLAGGPDCKALQDPPRSHIRHLAEGLVIQPTPDGAAGTSYAIYPANKGKHLNEDTAGQVGLYHDQYVRTAAGWRFAVRLHETSPVVDGRRQDGKPQRN